MNFTSGRKSVTGNGFSDIDFLHEVEILASHAAVRLFWRFLTVHVQFQPYYNFQMYHRRGDAVDVGVSAA